MARIGPAKQVLRGAAASKPTLKTGEFALLTDTNEVRLGTDDVGGEMRMVTSTTDDLSGHLWVDTDGTLAADDDDLIPTQKAVKTYVDAAADGGGGGGLTVDFELEEDITQGQVVQLLVNGNIEKITESPIPEAVNLSSAVYSGSTNISNQSISFDPINPNRFVLAYVDVDNESYGTAVVGTISGTNISFGPKQVFATSLSVYINVRFDPHNSDQILLVYRCAADSYYCSSRLGAINGSTITFGDVYMLTTTIISTLSFDFDPNTSGKFVIAYGSSSKLYSRVGTISGGVITTGAIASTSYYPDEIQVCFDKNTANMFAIAYRDPGDYGEGKCLIGTITGTNISLAAPYIFSPNGMEYLSVDFDPFVAGKLVFIYNCPTYNVGKHARIGEVSGTAISFGTEVELSSTRGNEVAVGFDKSTQNKVIFLKKETASPYRAEVVIGTVSGTDITLGATDIVGTGACTNYVLASDPHSTAKFVIAYEDGSSYAAIGEIESSASNFDPEKIVGILQETGLATETKTVAIKGGISTVQSGLTQLADYYVGKDGTIVTSSAAPNVKIGRAIDATTLILEDLIEGGVTEPIQSALDLKAGLVSPALTGAPSAPTAALATNTTQLANTAFVRQEIDAIPEAGGASFFDATVGASGADYTTLSAAFAADKHNIQIIDDVTETASMTVPTGTFNVTAVDKTVQLNVKSVSTNAGIIVQADAVLNITGVNIQKVSGSSSTAGAINIQNIGYAEIIDCDFSNAVSQDNDFILGAKARVAGCTFNLSDDSSGNICLLNNDGFIDGCTVVGGGSTTNGNVAGSISGLIITGDYNYLTIDARQYGVINGVRDISTSGTIRIRGADFATVTGCYLKGGILTDHDCTFINVQCTAAVTCNSDRVNFTNCRFGADAGGGSNTLTIDATADNTILTNCRVDADIVDNGTNTEGAYRIY